MRQRRLLMKEVLTDGIKYARGGFAASVATECMGTRTSEEMYRKLRVTFIEIDADKNGTISIQELKMFFKNNDDADHKSDHPAC